MNKTDYIVIGGGVIGMMTARELALRGASVSLFDRGRLGMESTVAAGGILSSMRPWLEHPSSAELSEYGKRLYPDYASQLQGETAIDPEYSRSGLIIIEQEHIDKIRQWSRYSNIKLQDAPCLLENDIQLSSSSVFLPEIAQIRPPGLIKALVKSLNRLSVSVYENTVVERLNIKNGKFTGLNHKNGKTRAEAVIITAGAWSQQLIKNLDKELPIKPIHGQMLCLKPVEKKIHSMVLDGSHYLIPRLDNHLLIGSTMEDIGFNKVVTLRARQDLLEWGSSIWPALEQAEQIKHWSGLRPSTEDGRPFIGPIDGYKNIYLNTGHFRKGILQAPASAELLVDYLLDQPLCMDIDQFGLHRRTETGKIV